MKKLLIAFLLFVLMIPMFSACTDDDADDSGDNGNKTPSVCEKMMGSQASFIGYVQDANKCDDLEAAFALSMAFKNEAMLSGTDVNDKDYQLCKEKWLKEAVNVGHLKQEQLDKYNNLLKECK